MRATKVDGQAGDEEADEDSKADDEDPTATIDAVAAAARIAGSPQTSGDRLTAERQDSCCAPGCGQCQAIWPQGQAGCHPAALQREA